MTDTLTAIIAELRARAAKRAELELFCNNLADRLEKLRGDAQDGARYRWLRKHGLIDTWEQWIDTNIGYESSDPGPIVHPWDAVGTRNQPEPPINPNQDETK